MKTFTQDQATTPTLTAAEQLQLSLSGSDKDHGSKKKVRMAAFIDQVEVKGLEAKQSEAISQAIDDIVSIGSTVFKEEEYFEVTDALLNHIKEVVEQEHSVEIKKLPKFKEEWTKKLTDEGYVFAGTHQFERDYNGWRYEMFINPTTMIPVIIEQYNIGMERFSAATDFSPAYGHRGYIHVGVATQQCLTEFGRPLETKWWRITQVSPAFWDEIQYYVVLNDRDRRDALAQNFNKLYRLVEPAFEAFKSEDERTKAVVQFLSDVSKSDDYRLEISTALEEYGLSKIALLFPGSHPDRSFLEKSRDTFLDAALQTEKMGVRTAHISPMNVGTDITFYQRWQDDAGRSQWSIGIKYAGYGYKAFANMWSRFTIDQGKRTTVGTVTADMFK